VTVEDANRMIDACRKAGKLLQVAHQMRYSPPITKMREMIDQVEGTPILSDKFESSVPGLYFVGLTAANSFGPLLRFMVGAEFAAPRLAAHLRHRVTMTVSKKAA